MKKGHTTKLPHIIPVCKLLNMSHLGMVQIDAVNDGLYNTWVNNENYIYVIHTSNT